MRALLISLVVVALWSTAAPAGADDTTPSGTALSGEWLKYRNRFVGEDGRVRDTGNHDVSHTEGQGWAMLFADAFDDRASFDRVWGWTRGTLRQPEGALFSWRWDPNGKTPIADANDASDGDILITWALARAARRWHAPEYAAEARRIVADIRQKLIKKIAGRVVLLPGVDGFVHDDGSVVVNPSYYVYPALTEFPRLDGSAAWGRLRRDGLQLLTKARFGEWQLPPDWVAIDKSGAVAPAPAMPPRFGFDAIRIPLYVIWGREAAGERLASEMQFWGAFGDRPIPAWVDVTSGALAPFPAPAGFRAVIDLVRARLYGTPAPAAHIDDSDDYYSASLILLAALAGRATER